MSSGPCFVPAHVTLKCCRQLILTPYAHVAGTGHRWMVSRVMQTHQVNHLWMPKIIGQLLAASCDLTMLSQQQGEGAWLDQRGVAEAHHDLGAHFIGSSCRLGNEQQA